MKKRAWFVFTCAILILFFCVAVCMKKICKKIQLNESVQSVLELKGFGNCTLIKFGRLDEIEEQKVVLEITKKEIEEYITSRLEDNAYRKRIVDRVIVLDKDLAIVDYKIIDGTNEIEHITDAPIRVGSGYYDVYLEEMVLGREVGKEYVVDWKVADSINDSKMIGKEMKVWFVVRELYEVIIPTLEEYVLQTEFKNPQEYVEHVKKILLENKKRELTNRTVELVVDKIIDTSEFIIDDEKVIENAIQYYYQYEQWAEIYEMEVNEFIKKSTKDNVYEKCYKQSLREIQRYIVIGRYAYLKEIEVSEEDIIDYCRKEEIIKEEISEEDMVYVQYKVLEKKVLKQICCDYVIIK